MTQPVIGNFQLGSFADTNTPNGIADLTDSIISFNDGTSTFTITPVGDDYIIYIEGTRIVIDTPKDIIISNDQGFHHIYFDADGELHETLAHHRDLFVKWAFVAEVYWSASTAESVFVIDERHGITMSSDTKYYINSNPNGGTIYVNGLSPTNLIIDGDGSLDSHAQFGLTDGEILHVDIQTQIIDNSPQDIFLILNAPILYRIGAGDLWLRKEPDNFPFIYAGQEGSTGILVSYNEWSGAAWQLTEMANNDYMLIHVFASSDINTPIFILQGINTYSTNVDATTGANDELVSYTGLPFQKGTPLMSFIIQTTNAATNAPLAMLVSTSDGDDFIDWRQAAAANSTGSTVNTGDLGEFTLATLPTPSVFPDNYALVTDAAGGRTVVRSDGTNWKVLVVEGATVT